MAYFIHDTCISCGACEPECPVSCISEGPDKYVINPDEDLRGPAPNTPPKGLSPFGIPLCLPVYPALRYGGDV
jgi:ferredoxin